MPRPTSKHQLLIDIAKEHAALEALISGLAPEQLTAPGTVGPWSAKDVLAHLTAWEQMVLAWYAAGKCGEVPRTPAGDLTWRQIPELNQRIFEAHCDEPLAIVFDRFRASYAQIFAAARDMTEEELFAPGYYAWTRTTTLGSYVTSATCSHYLWARNEIRKGMRRGDQQ